MAISHVVTCHEKADVDGKHNLAVFEKLKIPFYDLAEATRYAREAIEAIRRTRAQYPVQHPVIVVKEKKTGRAKYRVELTPTDEIIETQLVL